MKTHLSCISLTISLLFFMATQAIAQWIQTEPFDVNIFAFEKKGLNLYAGAYDGGVYLSTDDGGSWTSVNTGLTNTYVSALAVGNNNLFAGTDNGVFISTNNGATWNLKGLAGKYIQTLLTDGIFIYAGTFGEGAFRSTNNGTNWTPINSGLNSDHVICLAALDTTLFAGTWGGGVFRSTNNGNNWITVNTGLTNMDVRSLVFIDTNIFAGTYGGGVYISKNRGTNWTPVNIGLGNKNILPLTFSGNNLFAGTNGGGVFLSTNFGTNWLAINTGLTNFAITALKVMGSKIFAGTVDTGIWWRPLSEIITSVENNYFAKLNTFNLYQNHPNPFNSTTRISFSIPENTFVSLKIFDALGREVTTLLSEQLTTGEYSKDWDAAELTSGTYFFQLVAGNYKETKKMILLR